MIAEGTPKESPLRPCMSKRDLRAVSAPCQRDAYSTSHIVVSALVCKKTWGAGHSRSDVILGRNVCTAESPAYGDHCNANAPARISSGEVIFLTVSLRACLSLTVRTWRLFWLGLLLMRCLRNTVRSPVRTRKKTRRKDWTGHECDARNKRFLSARWVGKRRYCDIRMKRHTIVRRSANKPVNYN